MDGESDAKTIVYNTKRDSKRGGQKKNKKKNKKLKKYNNKKKEFYTIDHTIRA